MATLLVSSDQEKYASASSWTSGQARQGVYGGTRYEGALRFSGLSALNFGNILISQIKLTLTFGASGGSSTKNVGLYRGDSNTISGSISAMRGSSIGSVAVSGAYNATKTITFNSSTNTDEFNKMRAHFMGGMYVLILWVGSTRGTYPGGYCYDYLSVTSAKVEITYEFLQSDGALVSNSVDAGTNATLNITAYNSAYTHKVTWALDSYSTVQTIGAGVASATYQIPLTWCNAMPSALSKQGSVKLGTFDAAGVLLGSYTYTITIKVPASVIPTIGSVTATPVNDNAQIAAWGIFVQGKSKAQLNIVGALGAQESTIAANAYNLTTSPNIGSANAASLLTNYLTVTGPITVSGKVTDSRGRTSVIKNPTSAPSVYAYGAPSITVNELFRANGSGVRDDVGGTYARIKVTFSASDLGAGRNTVTGKVTIKQNGGGNIVTDYPINSGQGYNLGGSLVADAAYTVSITVTDKVGTSTSHTGTINSASYVMHVKKGGKAVGFGMAAGVDNTASFGWAIKLPTTALEVSQGGTGARDGASACNNIGAVKKSGDTMTGKLRLSQGIDVHMATGTDGSAGWVQICTLTVNATYRNAPIEIDISQRTLRMSSRLYINFTNVNHLDPALASFYYTGVCKSAYIVRTAAGVWALYVEKADVWDYISVVGVRKPEFMNPISIAWTNVHASSVPGGATRATYGYGDEVIPVANGGTGYTNQTQVLASFMPLCIFRNPTSETMEYNSDTRLWLFDWKTFEGDTTAYTRVMGGTSNARYVGVTIPITGFYQISMGVHCTDNDASTLHARVYNMPAAWSPPSTRNYMLNSEISTMIQIIYNGTGATSSANSSVTATNIMYCTAGTKIIPAASLGNVSKVINTAQTRFSIQRVG